MGRQVQIFATQEDVDSILAFLRRTTEIAIFRLFAESVEDLWIERPSDWTFYVWNQRFPWSPEYRRVGEKAYHPEMIGWYYVANKNIAPIIEIDCGDLSKRRAGRIYWSKDFAAPRGLGYDISRFTEWYESLVRWVQKNGRRLASERLDPYYLPAAWKSLSEGE